MAIWQFTLNGNPARDGGGNLIAVFDDGTGAAPGNASFANGEKAAAAQLATLRLYADGMTIQAYAKANSYNPGSGTHTYKG